MEPRIVAYFVCSVMLELVLLCWCCKAAWKHRQQCRELLSRSIRMVKMSFCREVVRDKQVVEGIRQYRCLVADHMLTFFICLLGLAVFTVQLNLLSGGLMWLSEGQMWLVIALMTFTVLAKVKSKHLLGWRLDAMYVVFALICVAYVSPWVNEAPFFAKSTFLAMSFVRMPGVAFVNRKSVLLACNIFSLAHAAYRVRTEDFTDMCDPFSNGVWALHIELMCCGGVLGFALFMDHVLQQKADLEVERGAVARQLSAASSLLRLTCDAVIELDKNMRLTHDSPELSTMLLRSGTASLEGSSFLELMVPEDALRAREYLLSDSEHSQVQRQTSFSSASSDRQISARAFHTRLVDSYNGKICTEVFQVRFTKLDGQKCNLLGLRDFTDVKPLAGENAEDAVAEQQSSTFSMPISMWMSPVSSDLADSDMDSPQASAPSPTPSAGKETLYLDIDMEGLLVHAASIPLAHLAGKTLREVFPSPHTSLLLQSLHVEVVQRGWQDVTSRVLTYKELPFVGLRAGITGTMQVARTRYEKIHVFMAFLPSRPERKAKMQRHPSMDRSTSLTSL